MNHVATFVVSGQYRCVLIATKRQSLATLMDAVTEDRTWRGDIKRVDDSAFWYGFGADVVSIPVSVYEAGRNDDLPPNPARLVETSFVSRGERIYLECITGDGFADWTPSFYLARGRFRVVSLAWNLGREDLEAEEYIPDLMQQERHDLIFIPE